MSVIDLALAGAAADGARDDILPMLRQDLELTKGPLSDAGELTWRIYDPLRHRYIAIDHPTWVALTHWTNHDTVVDLASTMSIELGQAVEVDTLKELLIFLDKYKLTEAGPDHNWQQEYATSTRPRHGLLMGLFHNYLFLRIPLFAPEPLLRRLEPISRVFFSRWTHFTIALMGISGLWLVSRQWDEFLRDAGSLGTAAGLAQFGVTLFFVKILHEFGHALAARRYGCRVPVMGLAFMLMVPLLYTDVTDAWRLQSRWKRFVIDAAGVAVELSLACVATFVWSFLPEGPARQTMFLIATTSWIMSIAINLNPFMRFDGYYIASDLMKVENLQSRSFSLAVWKMREILFGLGRQPNEVMRRRRRNTLIVYGWAVWLYRLILFTGIALVVYAFFFKALGLLLFVLEIGYFIARPIAGELKEWWIMRRQILATRRTWVTLSVVSLIAMLIFVPWSTNVTIPAVLEAADIAHIHAKRPVMIRKSAVALGQKVRKGELLFTLEAPDLQNELRINQAKLNSIESRLKRLSGDDRDRRDRIVLTGQRDAIFKRSQGIRAELAELNVRAPIDGVVAEINPDRQPGRWLAIKEPLALIRSTEQVAIVGYVSEADVWRIIPGAKGQFVPDLASSSTVETTLLDVATSSSPSIDIAELAEPNGGQIRVTVDERQILRPTLAQYHVKLAVEQHQSGVQFRHRGVVQLRGTAESIFAAVWRRMLQVLVRESSA